MPPKFRGSPTSSKLAEGEQKLVLFFWGVVSVKIGSIYAESREGQYFFYLDIYIYTHIYLYIYMYIICARIYILKKKLSEI